MKVTILSSGASARGLQRALDGQAERVGEGVGHAGVGGVGVGVRGEQRAPPRTSAVHQRALRSVRADPVHAAQQQRVVRDQQLRAGVEGLVDGLGDRIDRDEDAGHRLGRVAADEPDRVPALCERGRVGGLERGDHVGQPGGHAGTSASAVARPRTSCCTCAADRTATRTWSGDRPGNVSPRRTATPAARSSARTRSPCPSGSRSSR